MTQIPAGWYPDPAPAQPGQPPMVRYWNGAVWTENVAPAAPAATPAPTPAPPMYGAPAAHPAAAPPTDPTTPDGQRIAGWWWRVGAFVVDNLALGVVAQVVMIPFTLSFNDDLTSLVDEWEAADQAGGLDASRMLDDFYGVFQDNALALAIPTLVTSLLYFVLFWRFLGATPGQLAFGLKVRLRERPGNLGFATATVRWLVLAGLGGLSYLFLLGPWQTALLAFAVVSVFFLLNALWATWDPMRQCLHDKVARTNVVKAR